MIDRHLLLDNSALINILATDRGPEILRIFPAGVGVCTAVEGEALYLRNEQPSDPPSRIVLTPFIDSGLLMRHELRNADEMTTYVNLAVDLDDGEAMTLAIARHRQLAIATDDRKAQRIALEKLSSHLTLLRTTEIIHGWAQHSRPGEAILRVALKRIEVIARYRPANDDPLREWWTLATA